MGDQGAEGAMVGDQPPPGYKDPGEASTSSWQWARDLLLPLTSGPTVTLQSLKKCIQAVKLGRLEHFKQLHIMMEIGLNDQA